MNQILSSLANRIPVIVLFYCLFLAPAMPMARADEPAHKCARCGSDCPTCKICRAVEETKKVAKTEFECACEDFCVPGRSNLCGVDKSCDDCGNVKCTRIWEPTCAQVRSRRVLKKKTVEQEVKGFKWVVEELCDACAAACEPEISSGEELKKPDAKPTATLGHPSQELGLSQFSEAPHFSQSAYYAPESRPTTTFSGNTSAARESRAGKR